MGGHAQRKIANTTQQKKADVSQRLPFSSLR
nr:MAG TPA: hypothetical protein [Caudoviricetes sp.]DAR24205.1 MAG TPA: hypothetical protein [Caudoviricetes sp.]